MIRQVDSHPFDELFDRYLSLCHGRTVRSMEDFAGQAI